MYTCTRANGDKQTPATREQRAHICLGARATADCRLSALKCSVCRVQRLHVCSCHCVCIMTQNHVSDNASEAWDHCSRSSLLKLVSSAVCRVLDLAYAALFWKNLGALGGLNGSPAPCCAQPISTMCALWAPQPPPRRRNLIF